MKLLQLEVVVWKNLIIRKRHWFLTILEALLPITLFLLIAYGRSKIKGLNKIEHNEVTYSDIVEIRNDVFSVESTYLLYTPNTEFYKSVIHKTQVHFQMQTNNVHGFSSEEDLLEYYHKHHNYTVVAVIFKGDHKKFTYSIRYHDADSYYNRFLNTAEMYSNAFQFQPGQGTDYLYKGFLSVQKALDMSFIAQSKGWEDIGNISISMLEFPYPPYKLDSALNTLFREYLPLITLFSFISLCPAVLKRVVEEKYSGTKELMKMVGMKSWMLWLGWFIYGMIPMLFSVTWIVILMKVPFFEAEYPPIEYSSPGVLFCFLILYCMAVVVFCFAISSFFSKPTIAMVTGILLWILSYFVPKYSLGLDQANKGLYSVNILLNLLPNMALHYGYSAISTYEERELGIQWDNFYTSGSGGVDDVTMLNVFIMLLFDIVFYMLFTFYMDGVSPGKYGVPKSILFPIKDLFKFVQSTNGKSVKVESETVRLENVEDGCELKKGIEIHQLCKRFGPKVAVHNLNLDIYQNNITVLLGHNGAGKSTTMSMITGMLDVTSGFIKMNGKNIKNNMDEIRQTLGLCPQHNLLFTDLTVREHLIFFAKLKGKTSQEAEEEMNMLLSKMNMAEKKNVMANTLSGGMKRKLCLGMALIGGSQVLILDEPSSGMDPQSRRELWDLLLSWRGEKTILITTHFMEEADALGDWIAIMSQGSLQCYGTPMFLKKRYDTGYHLSLMVTGHLKKEELDNITAYVVKHLKEAKLKSHNGNNLVYILPFEHNKDISTLLDVLEKEKDNLKIENISITVTTLEDVFLKARVDAEQIEDNQTLDTCALLNSDVPGREAANNMNLLTTRLNTLFVKRFQFLRRRVFTYLVPTVIALVFFCLTVYLSNSGNNYYSNNGPELKLDLSVYKKSTVFYRHDQSSFEIGVSEAYQQKVKDDGSEPIHVGDVQKAIISKSLENIVYYKNHIIAGAEFGIKNSKLDAVALYNAIAIHSPPISLNLITDSLAKVLLGKEYSISIANWPLETVNDYTSPQEYSKTTVTMLWLIMIPIGCLFLLGSFILFPHIEISTKFAQMQYMCGVKPIWYWLVNFFADLSIFIVMVIPMALIVCIFSAPFRGANEFGALLLILIMYGVAGIPFAYLFSRKKSSSGGFALFVILGMFLGIILTLILKILQESGDAYYVNIGNQLKYWFLLFIPQVALTYSGVDYAGRAVWLYNMVAMPKKMLSRCAYERAVCCPGEPIAECEKYKEYLPLLCTNFLLMFGSFLIYLIINILLDTYWVQKQVSHLMYKISKLRYCMKNIESSPCGLENIPKYTLTATGINKNFSGKQIVNNINLTLNNGECLGILGVNGAGKTTTFRMLTREIVLDEGRVNMKLENVNYEIDDDRYLETLGYCPQTDCLNYVLTGREILTLITRLRGEQDPKQVAKTVDEFLELFELTEYADKPCEYYSGGNKRKLSLAVSLIGFRQFILLDEPTNGVDPSSRRKCWNLIKGVQENKKLSFILTSHSMIECEALCNTLNIMKDGEFVKQGPISSLKKAYGGFTIKLKLKDKTNLSLIQEEKSTNGNDEVDGPEDDENLTFSSVAALKNYFIEFKHGEIKDEHSGLLHVYMKDENKKWSDIFKEVETIMLNNPHLIEDYAISEASLEDVFLSVARGDDENKKKSKKLKKTHTNTV